VKRIIHKSALAVIALAMATATTLGALGALGSPPAGAQSGSSGKVTVGDNYFKPDDIEITAGTKVTWTNKGKILHSIKPNSGNMFGTKALASGKKYSYTFKTPGTYAYYCTFHGGPGRGQHGTIVVKAAPTTSTTSLLNQKSG
jgi:plastocyanin